MSEIISINFPIEIKNNKTHRFYIEVQDNYLDGEDVEEQYSFKNDINRIALAKPNGYETVLIITTYFNVRYTNWCTIAEARRNLQHKDIVANCITINGKKEYIIAREDDYIDDVFLPLVTLTHIDSQIDNDIITALFKKEVKGAKNHYFRIEMSDLYFDSSEIDSEYAFSKSYAFEILSKLLAMNSCYFFHLSLIILLHNKLY